MFDINARGCEFDFFNRATFVLTSKHHKKIGRPRDRGILRALFYNQVTRTLRFTLEKTSL